MALIAGFPLFNLDAGPVVSRLNSAFEKVVEQLGGVGPSMQIRPGNLGLVNHAATPNFRNSQKAERYAAACLVLTSELSHAALPVDAELAGVGLTIGSRTFGDAVADVGADGIWGTVVSGSLTVSADQTPIGSWSLAVPPALAVPGMPYMWRLTGQLPAGSRITAAVADPVVAPAAAAPGIPWEVALFFRVTHRR